MSGHDHAKRTGSLPIRGWVLVGRLMAVGFLAVLISAGSSTRASAESTREYLHYCAFGAAIGATVSAISVSPALASGAGTPGALGVIGTGAAFTCGIAVVGKAGSDIVMWVYDRYISDNPIDNIKSRIADATAQTAPGHPQSPSSGI